MKKTNTVGNKILLSLILVIAFVMIGQTQKIIYPVSSAGVTAGDVFSGTTNTPISIDDWYGTETISFGETRTDEQSLTLSCPAAQQFCVSSTNNFTIPVPVINNINAIESISYSITGQTNRNGTGIDASGVFNSGLSTIKWTVQDVNGNTASCETTVTVYEIKFPGQLIVQPNCTVRTGTITFNASSSAGTLEYSVDGGVNWSLNKIFSGLPPGVYHLQVRVQELPSCVNTAGNTAVQIIAPANCCIIPTITGATDIVMETSSNTCNLPGNYVLNISGAYPDISYSLSGATAGSGNGTGSMVVYAPGVTTVTVFASNSCGADTATFTVTVKDIAPPIISCPAEQVFCRTVNDIYTIPVPRASDNCSATVTYEITGATIRSGGSDASGVFNPGISTITWTIVDAGGQTASCSATVTVHDVSIAGVVVKQPTCNVVTGTITINANSSEIIEYSLDGTTWSASNTFNNVPIGSYMPRARVKAWPQCVATYNNAIVLDEATGCCLGLIVTGAITTQPTCAVPTGVITINAASTEVLEYGINGTTWSESNTFSGLTEGSYTISARVKARPTCESTYDTLVVLRAAANCCVDMMITGVTTTAPTCDVPVGSIVIAATANEILEYSIDDGATWSATSTFSGLPAGTYNILVRKTANPECVATYGSNPLIFTQPLACCIPPVIEDIVATQPDCDVVTGTISITASSITMTKLEYSINGSPWSNNRIFSGLAPGSYLVSVRLKDIPNCVTTYNRSIVIVGATGCCTAPASINVSVSQPECPMQTGTIVINAVSNELLQYSIDDGTTWSDKNYFSAINEGSYNISVRSIARNYCVFGYSGNPVLIMKMVPPSIGVMNDIIANAITSPCNVPIDYSSPVINGTNPLITYLFEGATTRSGSGTGSGELFNIGTTTVTIKAANKCDTVSTSFDVTVNDSEAPTISCVANVLRCQSIDGIYAIPALIASDNCGIASITYAIAGKTNRSGVGADVSGAFAPGLSTITWTVKDVNDNTVTCEAAVNIYDLEFMAQNVTQPTCTTPTGTIAIYATTNFGTLKYSIDGGATWSVNNVFTNLPIGTYYTQVRIEENLGCIKSSTSNPVYLVTASNCCIVPVISGIADTTVTNFTTTCTVKVDYSAQVIGAAPTIKYSFSGATTGSGVGTGSGSGFYPGVTTATISAANGCGTDTARFTITVKDITPPIITSCPSSQVFSSTLIGDYDIPVPIIGESCYVEESYQVTGATIRGGSLDASGYFHPGVSDITWTFKDASGNVTYCNSTVTVYTVVISDIVITQPTCAMPVGKIVINATGFGTIEYSIDGGVSWSANNVFSSLSMGSYVIQARIQEKPDCMAVYSSNPVVLEVEPGCCIAPVITDVTTTQPVCNEPTGIITIQAHTVQVFEYSIDGGASWSANNTFSNLEDGSYAIRIRVKITPSCETAYEGNPVILQSASVPLAIDSLPDIYSLADDGTCSTTMHYEPVITGTPGTVSYTFSGATTGSGTGSGSGSLFNAGTTTVTLTATNDCGSYSETFHVVITDNQEPVVYCMDDQIVWYTGAPTYQVPRIFVTDNCGIDSITYVVTGKTNRSGTGDNASGPFLVGVSTIKWTVKDVNGNTSTCEAYVNVYELNFIGQEVIQPTCFVTTGGINIQAKTSFGTIEYSVDNGTTWSLNNVFTNLPIGEYKPLIRIQENPTRLISPANGPVYLVAARNCCVPPVITGAADIVVKNSVSTCNLSVQYALSITGTYPTVNYSFDGAGSGSGTGTGSGQLFHSGITTVRVIASNSCGADTAIFTVDIQDTVPPLISCLATQAFMRRGDSSYTVRMPQVTDNCGLTFISYSISGATNRIGYDNASGLFNHGLSTITWTAEDIARNVATCETAIHIYDIDILGQTVTQPTCDLRTGTIVVNATSTYGTLEYSMDGGATWSLSNVFSGLPEGSYKSQVRIQENPGEVKTDSNAIQLAVPPTCCVIPVIAGAANIARNITSDACDLPVYYNLSSTGVAPEMTYSFSGVTTGSGTGTGSGASFNIGTTIVVVTATNSCGADTITFTVTVKDVAPPVIMYPDTILLLKTLNDSYTIPMPQMTNSCPVTIKYTITGTTTRSGANDASGLFNPGVSTIVWTVEDASGNIAVHRTVVRVYEITVTPPVITQPTCSEQTGTITINAASNYGTLEYSIDGGAIWSQNNVFSGLPAGSYDQQVRIQENPAEGQPAATNPVQLVAASNCCVVPVISGAADILLEDNGNNCGLHVNYTLSIAGLSPDVNYACSGATTGSGTGTGSGIFFNAGITTVTVTSSNVCGADTATFIIKIKDISAPVISYCPAAQVFTSRPGNTYTIPLLLASDNCASSISYAITGVTNRSGTGNASGLFYLGVSDITWTVRDAAGNTASCVTQVSVVNNGSSVSSRTMGAASTEPLATSVFNVKVYSNPTPGDFRLFISTDDIRTPIQVQLHDISGRLVGKVNSAQPNSITRLSSAGLVNGTYIAEVTQGNKKKLVKMVLLH